MRPHLAFAVLLLAACGTHEPPDIAVEDGWARATAAGQDSTAAYFTIINRGGGDDRLIHVSVPRAGHAMLHGSSMKGGVVRMRHLPDLAIPAGATIKLAPNGTHIMVSGLATPLRANDEISATLHFAKAGTRNVTIKIEEASAR